MHVIKDKKKQVKIILLAFYLTNYIPDIIFSVYNHYQNKLERGAWEAQSVEHLTLDLNSGLDLRVVNSSFALGTLLGFRNPKMEKT